MCVLFRHIFCESLLKIYATKHKRSSFCDVFFLSKIKNPSTLGTTRVITFSKYFKNYISKKLLVNISKIHKVVHKNVPSYLDDKICFERSVRQNGLLTIHARTELYRRSTFVRGATLWNSLPNSVKGVRSETVFKQKCRDFFSCP